jgi:type I restriction enzyme S subunit
VEQLGYVQLGRQRSPDKLKGISPTRYIRAANITEAGIDFSDVLEMDFSEQERATFALRAGDVLLTEASGSSEHVGRPAIWPSVDGLYCFQNTVLRFQPQGVSSEFAFYSFLAMQKLGVFRKLSGGVGINHLSAGKFSKLPVALPSSDEQVEIVRELMAQLAGIEEQGQAIDLSLKQSAAQRQNILRAAFAGQLVPQDPNDEPASVLLARIRAERAAKSTINKPRGRKA